MEIKNIIKNLELSIINEKQLPEDSKSHLLSIIEELKINYKKQPSRQITTSDKLVFGQLVTQVAELILSFISG